MIVQISLNITLNIETQLAPPNARIIIISLVYAYYILNGYLKPRVTTQTLY